MKLCMGCMEEMEDNATVCPHCGYNESTLRQESYYLDPGTVVGGKYIVGRVIKYGGYTITYLGMDAEVGRKVLVKEYLPSDFSTRSDGESEVTIYSGDAVAQFEQGLTTFLNEANRIQHLQNAQGIENVYDCVAENDTGYVISEYLEGQTLKQILEAGKTYTPEEAKNFIAQILSGLCQVHPLDIIHCDISPETILVTTTGEIKLLDFGATRYVTTANSKSLAIILKQGYAPEEQYRSKGVRGPWTDVYALAAVMYRMITGKVPEESVDRALVDELKEPSKLGINIPQNMENAMMNALNVYQNNRTPSADIFLKELNSAQVKRIQVKKQKYETGKFPKWAKGLVAGLLCLVIAGGVIVAVKWNNNPSEIADKSVRAKEIVGKTMQEAKKEMPEIELIEKAFYFKKGISGGTEIIKQDPASGSLIKNNKIECEIMTSEKCTYSDILADANNVNDLALTLNVEKSKCIEEKEASDKEDESKQYFNLYSIILNDGSIIKYDALGKDQKKALEIKNIKNITYYISPFLFKEKMENYVGQKISDVKFDKCKVDTDNKPKQTGETGTPTQNQKYYSLTSKYNVGVIIHQNDKYKKGTTYNSSEAEGSVFDTVKEFIPWTPNSNAEDIKSKLTKLGITVKEEGSGSLIASVKASGTGAEKNGQLFTEESTVTITKKEAPPTQAPVIETDKPAPNNNSNNNNNNSNNNNINIV